MRIPMRWTACAVLWCVPSLLAAQATNRERARDVLDDVATHHHLGGEIGVPRAVVVAHEAQARGLVALRSAVAAGGASTTLFSSSCLICGS